MARKVLCEKMLLVTSLVIVIPVTLLFWLINIFFFRFSSDSEVWRPLSPYRWLLSIAVPIFIAKWGLKRKSLDRTGALAGLIVGFILTISNFAFCAALMAFFVSASKATKFRKESKRKIEEDYKDGGQRNWIQVLCNGGIAAELGLIYMIEAGCREYPIDFARYYSPSWLSLAVLGALACSSGDTYASEIGTVSGKGDPWLITTFFQRVPRGTNGGVSIIGLIASFIGGTVVGMGFYMVLIVSLGHEMLEDSPPQWLIIIIGGLAGLVGSVIDSVLGATFQYSGFDKERKVVVETPGKGVEDICGTPFLDNHGVNLLSSLLTALCTPSIGLFVYRTALNLDA